MTDNVVNLRIIRKQRKREEKRSATIAKGNLTSLSAAQKAADEKVRQRDHKLLDGKKIDP